MSNPITMALFVGALALAPFFLIMLTSYVKISVVLSILRSAIGIQQAPPNQVINGIALIVTCFVMYPVGLEVKERLDESQIEISVEFFSQKSAETLWKAVQIGKSPVLKFLETHAHEGEKLFFFALLNRASQKQQNPDKNFQGHFAVLIPSFIISELKEAFLIGFLIFLPFLIIDMVVANILQAMGMMMLSPSVISLPFKLLLFVLIDGWTILIRGLVQSYY